MHSLHTGCRVQEFIMHRMLGSGVCYTQGVEFRGALRTRVQGSGLRNTKSRRVQACKLHRLQLSGASYAKTAGFRSALHTGCMIQPSSTAFYLCISHSHFISAPFLSSDLCYTPFTFLSAHTHCTALIFNQYCPFKAPLSFTWLTFTSQKPSWL